MPKATKLSSQKPKVSQPCNSYYSKYHVSEDTIAIYQGRFGAIENTAVTARKKPSPSNGDSKPQDPLFKPYKGSKGSKTSSASSGKLSNSSDKASSLRVRFSSDNSSSASAAVAVPLVPTTAVENRTKARMDIVLENEVQPQTNVLENVIEENLESNPISSSLASPQILTTSLNMELLASPTILSITHTTLGESPASTDTELGIKNKATEIPAIQHPYFSLQDGNSSNGNSKSEAGADENSKSNSSHKATNKHEETAHKGSTERINLWKIIKRPRLYRGTHTTSVRGGLHSKLPTLASEPTLAEKALSLDDVRQSDNMAQTPLPIEAVGIEPFRPTRPRRHFGETFITLAPISYDIPPGGFPVRDSSRRPAVLNLLDYSLERGELVNDDCTYSIGSPTQGHIPGYEIALLSIPENEVGFIPPQRSISPQKRLGSSPGVDTAGPPPTYIPEAPTPSGSSKKHQNAIPKGKLPFNSSSSLPSSSLASTVIACDGTVITRIGAEMVVQKCLGPHETTPNSTGDAQVLCKQCPSSTPYGTRAMSNRALSNALSSRHAVHPDRSTEQENIAEHTNTKLGSDPMSKTQEAAMSYWYEEDARRKERKQNLEAVPLCQTNLPSSEGTPNSSATMYKRLLAQASISPNPSTSTSRRSDSQPQHLGEDSSRLNQNAVETGQHLFHPVSQITCQKAVIRPMDPVSGIFIPSTPGHSANATKLAVDTATTPMPIKQAARSGFSRPEHNATSRHIEQPAPLHPSITESSISPGILLMTMRETSKITVGSEPSDSSSRSTGNSMGLENTSTVPSTPKEIPENSDIQPMPFAGYPSMEAAFAKIRATEMENTVGHGKNTSGRKGVKGLLSKFRLQSSKK